MGEQEGGAEMLVRFGVFASLKALVGWQQLDSCVDALFCYFYILPIFFFVYVPMLGNTTILIYEQNMSLNLSAWWLTAVECRCHGEGIHKIIEMQCVSLFLYAM